MKRGPTSGATSVDYVAKVTISWAPDPPEFVLAVAREATVTSAAAVSRVLGYSASVVSQVLSNTYAKGDLDKFERVVRAKLLGETAHCPGFGKVIRTDRCRDQQKRPFSSSSPMAARLYEACRTCPNREVKS